MTPASHDWLPLSALVHPSVRQPFEDAVATWSERWFARRRLAAVDLQALAEARRDDADGGWRRHANGLAIAGGRRVSARLVGWALDADLETLSPTGLDRRVVDAFETALIGDLASRISAAVGLASPDDEPRAVRSAFDAPGGVVVGIADQGAPWFWLAVPFAAAVALRRSVLPAPRAARPPLSSRASARAATPLRLEARLVDVEMSLSDLSALGAGDVLVLDQKADSPAALHLIDGGPLARGLLTALDEHVALTLQS